MPDTTPERACLAGLSALARTVVALLLVVATFRRRAFAEGLLLAGANARCCCMMGNLTVVMSATSVGVLEASRLRRGRGGSVAIAATGAQTIGTQEHTCREPVRTGGGTAPGSNSEFTDSARCASMSLPHAID